MTATCVSCGERFPAARFNLGYRLCLPCGETAAKKVRHCVVPMNKSNYVYVSDRALLSQLNPKKTT